MNPASDLLMMCDFSVAVCMHTGAIFHPAMCMHTDSRNSMQLMKLSPLRTAGSPGLFF
jgi:hypothetical protein